MKLLELGVNHDAIKNQVRVVEKREQEEAEHVELIGRERPNKRCFKCDGDCPHRVVVKQ